MIYIGIDPGVNTGIAVWDSDIKEFRYVASIKIHKAIDFVLAMSKDYDLKVVVEDARKRRWYGANSNAKVQGAGSIKRDCKIWDDFLQDYRINSIMRAPQKGMTKMSAAQFKRLTGWKERTNEHSRDAAMLVYGY